MKLITSRMPSKGFACTVEVLEVPPLNYGQVMEYAKAPSNYTELSNLLWDIDYLIKPLEGWEKLSSFDLFPILCYRKLVTFNLKGKVNFLDGSSISLNDLEFSELSNDVLEIETIELGGEKYSPSIKSMRDFVTGLNICESKGISSVKLACVGTYLSIPPEKLLSLTGEDIALCERLYSKILSHPQVTKEGGAEVILTGKASDLFHYLSELLKVTDSKIQFRKKL